MTIKPVFFKKAVKAFYADKLRHCNETELHSRREETTAGTWTVLYFRDREIARKPFQSPLCKIVYGTTLSVPDAHRCPDSFVYFCLVSTIHSGTTVLKQYDCLTQGVVFENSGRKYVFPFGDAFIPISWVLDELKIDLTAGV